jgi:ABC-type lipoprotein release transport system permease subunit
VFRVDARVALAAAGGAVACGVVAAMVPAVRAMRVQVAAAMRRVGE